MQSDNQKINWQSDKQMHKFMRALVKDWWTNKFTEELLNNCLIYLLNNYEHWTILLNHLYIYIYIYDLFFPLFEFLFVLFNSLLFLKNFFSVSLHFFFTFDFNLYKIPSFNPIMHGRFYRSKPKVLWEVVKLILIFSS